MAEPCWKWRRDLTAGFRGGQGPPVAVAEVEGERLRVAGCHDDGLSLACVYRTVILRPMSIGTHLRLINPERARDQAERLFGLTRAALQSVLPTADIRHVGATAIRGCLTKGDLDIVVRVPAKDFAQAETVLATRYAFNSGSTRTTDFAAFEDATTDPPLGIQLTVIDGPFDFFHAFVEALCASSLRLFCLMGNNRSVICQHHCRIFGRTP